MCTFLNLRRILLILLVGAFALTTAGTALAGKGSLPPKGAIWFGKQYAHSGGNLVIVGRKSSFRVKDNIAWVAHLKGPAGSHSLMLTLWLKKSNGKLSKVWHHGKHITDVRVTELANVVPAQDFVTLGAHPGHKYVLTYDRKKTRLAAGGFSLKK